MGDWTLDVGIPAVTDIAVALLLEKMTPEVVRSVPIPTDIMTDTDVIVLNLDLAANRELTR